MPSRYVNFVDMSTPDDPLVEIETWISRRDSMPHVKRVRQSMVEGIHAATRMTDMFAVAYNYSLYDGIFRIESEHKTWFEAIQKFSEDVQIAYSNNRDREDFTYRLILLHKRNDVAYLLAEAQMTDKGIWKYKYRDVTPCPYELELELPF